MRIHALHAWRLNWPTNLLFIAAAAILSYYLTERPFARIKNRASPEDATRLPRHPIVPSAQQASVALAATISD